MTPGQTIPGVDSKVVEVYQGYVFQPLYFIFHLAVAFISLVLQWGDLIFRALCMQWSHLELNWFVVQGGEAFEQIQGR